MVIKKHYEKRVYKNTKKGRTPTFQVRKELFQRVKEFIIGLIERMLEREDEEFDTAEAAQREKQAESTVCELFFYHSL